jgi:branched-chain amino acid aminotransferase
VAEGVGFNVFLVKDGAIKTPEHDCLKGITRRTAMEIADTLGISCREADISAEELQSADEIFISSSAGGMFPVTVLNEKPVGNGRPGSITTRINTIYWEWRSSPEHTTPVSYR